MADCPDLEDADISAALAAHTANDKIAFARCVVDAQLPLRLAAWLREKGHDADHVAEVLGATARDRLILRHDQVPEARRLLWIGVGHAVIAFCSRCWKVVAADRIGAPEGADVAVLKE